MQYIHKEKELSVLNVYRFSFYALFEKFPFFLALILVYALSISAWFAVTFSLAFLPFRIKLMSVIQILQRNGANRADILLQLIKTARPEFWLAFFAALLSLFVFYRYLALGLTKISFKIYDNQQPQISDLFSCYHLIFKDMITTLIFYLMVLTGLAFFLIPGIYISVVFTLYHQDIVYKNAGIIESLQESFRLVRNYWWHIFSILFIYACISYAAKAIFGILAVIISPLAPLIYAYIYRKLLEIKQV